MTIKECIDIVDNIKPNQYTIRDKVMWLSFIDEIVINDVLKTHEGYDGRYDLFEGYTEDKLSVSLIVPSPYDRLYTAYLKMKIDGENGETARYNNSMVLFNTYMQEYRKHYNKTHMPLDATSKRMDMKPHMKPAPGLSDAEYENIKRDLTFILTEYFSDTVSPDKLNDAINKYLQNNVEMYKGKDGHTPIKGSDYWTEEDKNEIKGYVDKLIDEFKKTYPRKLSTVFIKGGADNWVLEDVTDASGNVIGSRYGQRVTVNNATITPRSKVDLQITSEQMVVFYEKNLAFVAENKGGVITVYCVGSVPQNDYTIQAVVTEVIVNG